MTEAIAVEIHNLLLEYKNFLWLINSIRIYFKGTEAKGIMARKRLIEIAIASLSGLMKN